MRILILTTGPYTEAIAKRVRTLGHEAVVVAGDMDSREIVRVARQHHVEGIFPPSEPAVVAVAQAMTELDLAGISPEAAARVCDKCAMRRAFEGMGIPNPAWAAAHTQAEATAATRQIGLPVIVKPADSSGGVGIRRVDHIEDIPLAFSLAARASLTKTTLIEAVVEGDEYRVEGVVYEGGFFAHAVTGREHSAPPFYFDEAIYAPAALTEDQRRQLTDSVSAAAQALDIHCGYLQADAILSADGPRIVEIAAYPSVARGIVDITALAGGSDSVAVALAMAKGQRPTPPAPCTRGAAMAWIPSHSGVVNGIEGIDDARAIPGVVDVAVKVSLGDVMGHMVDCPTRDRVGYVTAVGDTAVDALAMAKSARDLCRIVTMPAYT